MANKSGDNSLRDWFGKSKSSDGTPGWVQLGGKYAGKPCARQPGQKTKPKCGSSKMKRNLNKKEEQKAFRRKNAKDPNPNRKGKAINVATEETTTSLFRRLLDEKKKCWKGYKKVGTQKLFGKTYNRCVKAEELNTEQSVIVGTPKPGGAERWSKMSSQEKAEYTAQKALKQARGIAARYDAAKKAAQNVKVTSGSVNIRADVPEDFEYQPEGEDIQELGGLLDRVKSAGREVVTTTAGRVGERVGRDKAGPIGGMIGKRRGEKVGGKAYDQATSGNVGGAINTVRDALSNSYRPEGELMTEEQFDEAAGEKDACYHKVKSRYSVWPSAYASGALVKCRKVGAKNWGNKTKKEHYDWRQDVLSETPFKRPADGVGRATSTPPKGVPHADDSHVFPGGDVIKPGTVIDGSRNSAQSKREEAAKKARQQQRMDTINRIFKDNPKNWDFSQKNVDRRMTTGESYELGEMADEKQIDKKLPKKVSSKDLNPAEYIKNAKMMPGSGIQKKLINHYSWRDELEYVQEGSAWTKKSGKDPDGGLNEKGRKSYERENPGSDLKRPSKKVGNKRRASFCARMKGMKKKLTSKKTANDPDSRINKSLRAWNC